MGQYVKQLPEAAKPPGGLAAWPVAEAERWRQARVPAVFAPAGGSWPLLAAVAVAYGLTSGLAAPGRGTDWVGYPAMFLLAALPLWYRLLPAATLPAAVVTAVDAAVSVTSPATASDPRSLIGYGLVLAVSAWAFTGAALRLRSRRKQRELAAAAAGPRRFALPVRAPESDGYRGFGPFYLGLVLCLLGAGIITDGLVRDLTSPADKAAYDAIGQQIAAGLLLLPGATVLIRGQAAYRAARRLHSAPQPALLVGVRKAADGRLWLCPDAHTTGARPLIACAPAARDTRDRARLLGTASVYGPGEGWHDIDARSEPFEAVLYGAPCDGAEVALEYVCLHTRHHQGTEELHAAVTVAQLLPYRRHGLGPWEPADGSARDAARRQRGREDEQDWQEESKRREAQQREARARRAARDREEAERRHTAPWLYDKPRPRRRTRRSGRAGSWGGGAGCGGGDSCGGGCGGGD